MATQPQPPAKPAPAPPAPAAKTPAAKVEAAEAEPVKTIGDEQRERSAEIEKVGTAAYVEAHDERDPDEKPKAVAGVQHRPVEAHETRR